jgi:hypothetical protein
MEARDTEPMLFNGMKYVLSKLLSYSISSKKRGEGDVKKLKQELVDAFDEFI